MIADESGDENGHDGEQGEEDEESGKAGGREANARHLVEQVPPLLPGS